MNPFKIAIGECPNGYFAYAVGIPGAVVGQRKTYKKAALADVKSAIACHVEMFEVEIRNGH